MCIKTVKASQKREKSQPPWKLGERKWRLERMGEKKSVVAAWKRDLILVVPSALAIVFTKMSFCHSELQNCHS